MTRERTTVLETPFASLWHYPAERLVHHRLHRYVFGAAFRELLLAGAALVAGGGATRWLSDDRNGGAIGGEDRAWAVALSSTVLGPRLRSWAIVPPEAVVGRMSLRRIARERSAQGLDVRLFTSADDALEWIVTR